MKKWISTGSIESLSCALVIWAFASCEYKVTQAREETKRLELQLKYNQELQQLE